MTKHDFDITNELLQRMLELEQRLTGHEMTTAQSQMGRSDLSHKVRKLEDTCIAQNQIVRDQGRAIDHLERVVEGLKRATDDLACQKKTVEFIDDDEDCVNNDMLLIRYPAPWATGDGWTRWMRSNAAEEDQQTYIAILKDGGILSVNDANNMVRRQYRYGRP